jgi:hypothetical protein
VIVEVWNEEYHNHVPGKKPNKLNVSEKREIMEYTSNIHKRLRVDSTTSGINSLECWEVDFLRHLEGEEKCIIK